MFHQTMITTIETRLRLEPQQEHLLHACVEMWSSFYRTTWRLFNNHHCSEKEIYDRLMADGALNSHQVKSLINKVKGEHAKLKALTKTQLIQQQNKASLVEKFIAKLKQELSAGNAKIAGLKQKKTNHHSQIHLLQADIKKKRLLLHAKMLKFQRITKRIHIMGERLSRNTFKLCFGSRDLFRQQPGFHTDAYRLTKEQKVYDSKEQWLDDWRKARNNILYSVGDKNKPQGNAELQYYPETKTLRVRLVEHVYQQRLAVKALELDTPVQELLNHDIIKHSSLRTQARFMDIQDVSFSQKHLAKLQQVFALPSDQRQPITAKIIKRQCPNGRDTGYYLQLSFDEVIQPSFQFTTPYTMGVDLNVKGLAYCIVKEDGNKLKNDSTRLYPSHGFIPWDLNGKTSAQRSWIISNTIEKLLDVSCHFGIGTLAIEDLDFNATKATMNHGYKAQPNYNDMLSQFATSQFKDLLIRKTERLNMKLHLVNPSYSSIGGFTKYGYSNKLPVDVAASLWLARQSLYGKTFKTEQHIEYKKFSKESVTLPYVFQPKQSKKFEKLDHWRHMSNALGTKRSEWIRKMHTLLRPEVDQPPLISDHDFGR